MVCSMYRVGGGGGGRGAAGAAAPAGDAGGGRAGGNGRAGAPVVAGGAPAAAGRGDGPNLDRPLAPAESSIGSPEAMGAHRDAILEAIDVAAANYVPNVFLTAGSRRLDVGIDYARGAENAVAFCNSVKARAESKGVTLCMEFLNSKGYASAPMMLFDHMAWGVDVCKKRGDSLRGYSMTFSTRRSWKASSSKRFGTTSNTLVTSIPAACRAT